MFDTRSFFVFLIFVLFYRSCFAGWFTVGVFFVFGTGSLVPAHLLFLYAMHNSFSRFSSLLLSSFSSCMVHQAGLLLFYCFAIGSWTRGS
ncbi:hypothetical protein FOXYSP1_09151 [Fusarium oxysporum f. sp. phaseoli]